MVLRRRDGYCQAGSDCRPPEIGQIELFNGLHNRRVYQRPVTLEILLAGELLRHALISPSTTYPSVLLDL